VATILILRLTFTKTTITSSIFTQKPAFVKSYPSVPTDIEVRPGAIGMMVVGDSISQGFEGDFTWRYRLWEWFSSQGLAVDFVGPFIGTRPKHKEISQQIVESIEKRKTKKKKAK
jgi:hypothetical protein